MQAYPLMNSSEDIIFDKMRHMVKFMHRKKNLYQVVINIKGKMQLGFSMCEECSMFNGTDSFIAMEGGTCTL